VIRIDNDTANAVRPTITAAGTEKWWHNGDPGGGVPATVIEADWLNDIQANLEAVLVAGGITGTKGPGGDSDLIDAMNAILGTAATGLLRANFEWVAVNQVRFTPGLGGLITVEIDNVVLSQSANIVWELGDSGVGGSDLDTGSEATDTPYYLYLENSSGTLVQHLSATGPEPRGSADKVGYHPTNTTWRCVGSFWNDAGEDVANFNACRGGLIVLFDRDSSFTEAPNNAAYTALTINAPRTASAFYLHAECETTNGSEEIWIAPGDGNADSDAILHCGGGGGGDVHYGDDTGLVPNDDQTVASRIKYKTANGVQIIEVLGWVDDYAPEVA
jgi:hypothetical protein